MERYTLKNKPKGLMTMRKKTKVRATIVHEPFQVETQEGLMKICPETVDDWDNGYYLVYPEDGSKPYTWSPKFARENYEVVEGRD